MKKFISYHIYFLLFLFIAAGILSLPSCDDDKQDAPSIKYVRNYAASPNDTILKAVKVGQWVVVVGTNLSGVSQAYFGTTPATINSTFFSDTCIVIQIPSIDYKTVARDKVNEIILVNAGGTVSYKIPIDGAPLITRIRAAVAAPNDTILNSLKPGQAINIIGYNLKKATSISFQGVQIDINSVVFSDTSVVVTVPSDFSGMDAKLSNTIVYTTTIDKGSYYIPIIDPAILAAYNSELWVFLTGGLGKEKTWRLDTDAAGVSLKFTGPLYFSGVDYSWGNQCGGTDCWFWDPGPQGWIPTKDFGTMTFKLKGLYDKPSITVEQKGVGGTKDGIFNGAFFLDKDAKKITFTDIVPLNIGWDQVWTEARLISLTADGMQLAFRHTTKSEFEILNYIPKK